MSSNSRRVRPVPTVKKRLLQRLSSGPRSPDKAGLSLFQRELAQIGVAVAEQLGTAGQVLHVPVVDLFRLDRDRLVLMSLKRRRPHVERPRVVQDRKSTRL